MAAILVHKIWRSGTCQVLVNTELIESVRPAAGEAADEFGQTAVCMQSGMVICVKEDMNFWNNKF